MHRRVFTALVWLLAALWLPVSLHCVAETAGWFESLACCGGDETANTARHEELDHCASFEAGVVREDLAPAIVLPPPALAWLVAVLPVLGADVLPSRGVTRWSAAPPEIGGLWRATQRVVAAAQAP